MPTQTSTLLPDQAAALAAPRGDIRLAFCCHCGYISNQHYDVSKLDHNDSDVSLEHSPIFKEFSETLCRDMIEKYDLRGKDIVDIGCGDGDFLKRICAMGNNRGVGIDPGYNLGAPEAALADQVKFIKDYYSEQYAGLPADIVLCRHVLMDIENPKGFLQTVRKVLDTNRKALLYFEVPNARYSFGDRVVWNIIYEHGSWFTPESLSYLFQECGFEVLEVAGCWNGEYIGITARAIDLDQAVPNADTNAIREFQDFLTGLELEFAEIVSNWQAKIDVVKDQDKKVVVWGSGARGITFLNTYDLQQVVDYVVDINPKRQNMYIPGSGHEVKSLESLTGFQPDLVVIVNPTYAKEIKQQAKELGLNCEFWVL
jgi:SAM-dependent methyltransferase